MKGAVLTLLCAIAIAQGRELPTKQNESVCNCNPNEAQAICAERDSDDILIAHEYCNKFYKCANGAPIATLCGPSLLYDPVREVCDWPQNVDCSTRPIFEVERESGEGDDNNGDNDNGGSGTCNCNPAEAPSICANEGSDGKLIAHENCNQYYICNHGSPVTVSCGPTLLYNPYAENCDWAANVECGDRFIPEDNEGDNGGDENSGGESNETRPENCHCNPAEAPSICAAPGSDSTLIAHENCNQYYQCNHGVPISMTCQGTLLYNPYIERCDWPNNVDCGDRIAPCDCDDEAAEDCDESNSSEVDGGAIGGGDNGGGDTGGGDNGGNDNEGNDNDGSDSGDGSCNCNPGEAENICAVEESDGVLVAHENCNKFYKCAHGVPIPMKCYGTLLYNPYTEKCDWPENVDCGDRVIPDSEDNDNGGGDNGGSDNGGGDNGGGDNGGGDNGSGDNGGGSGGGNCDPSEAPAICAAEDSDGILVAHENCNKYYICDHGVPVPRPCPGTLLFNPEKDQCDWPEHVDCGDRIIPDSEDSGSGNDNGGGGNDGNDNGGGGNEGGDNGSGDNGGGTCNCNPGEAEDICAADGSDGVLVAHENCNQFYKCAHGVPVAFKCYGTLLYNPYTEQCDWPEKVDCGDRVIPDPEDNDNGGADNGGSDNGGGDSEGGDNGGGDNGGGDNGGGTCNCNPGEAEGICAADGSDGVLVAHENCNQFYKCAHGAPVAFKCYGTLLYNPYTEQCDWPEKVDCGDRVIPDPEDNDNGGADNGGSDNGGGDSEGGDNGGGDNGGGDNGGGTCNCNPGEAEGICAADGSDGVLVAHENCNQFYKCAHGVPVAFKCYGTLLYNPYTEQCDWPEKVDCGDRVIPDPEDNDNGGGDNGGSDNGGGDYGGGDSGGGDSGGGDNGGGDNGGGTCNCNPGEAEGICAADGSDGVLVAHENCNQFYKCAHGVPVALKCYGTLLYNPYTEQCDWPEKVDCGDRVIPDSENNDNGGGDNGGSDNGGGDNGGGGSGGGDSGGGDNGGGDNGGGTCNCNPGEAEGICAADGSDGVLVAHENCNQFYKCAHGVPVALKCYGTLLYNPYTEQCDWPEKVDCGDRVIPDSENNDNGGGDNGGSDNGGGDNGGGGSGGGDSGGGDNGGGDNGGGTCNCNPGEAEGICAADGSDGVLVAHENCNQFYKCAHGVPVALKCYGTLLYNPYTEQCDWPEKVDCGDRVIPDSENNDNGGGDNGGSDNGGGDNGGGGSGGGESGGGDNGGGDNGGGTCNCNPGDAEGICAADGSDGVLVAHENCNQFYKCAHSVPVALKCYGTLLYNPYTEQCDWPEKVDCGDRVIPDSENNDNGGGDNGGSDNGGGDNGGGDSGGGDSGGGDNGGEDNGGGTCNCNPGEAEGICAADGSDGVLVAHENCNQFYKCAHGVPVALKCYGTLLYNPYTEQCDWPEKVDCGDRVIPDTEDNDNGGGDNGGSDNGGGDNGGGGSGGGDSGGGDNGGGDNGGGTCNCNPGEAEGICAADGSDGVLVAHENCNQFYKCAHGVPVALKCYGTLLYNPYTEQCDWPEKVDCGDRVIPDSENNDNGGGDNGGSDNGGGDNGGGDSGGGDSGGGDNGGGDNGGGTCNCNPGEAEGICAADGSDGVLVAHENCNQFYKCAHGVPVALKCYGTLLYNPYTEQCDWPEKVDCGDRVIPDPEDNDNGGGDNGGSDNGGGDNGGGDSGGGDSGSGDNGGGDNGGGTCNCNPGEAEGICAADGSDGVLVAHENCNQFYKCAHGVPVALKCYGTLLYNPYTEQCDWPEKVDCGDRVIPDTEDNDNGGGDNGGSDNGGGDNGGGDSGGGDSGGGDNGGGDNGGGTCNCNPGEAEGICAADGSDGVLVAHENCNQFYKCAHGVPVALKCYGTLLYNPYTEQCDWPEKVDCGDRVIPDPEDNDNGGGDNGGSDNGGGDNGGGDSGGGDSGGGDNGGGDNGGGTCNCNPGEAEGICAADGSDGVLIAHENCNQFYKCAHGVPVALKCFGTLLYNPYTEQCDWPEKVDCGDRVIPDPEDNDNGGGDNGGSDNGGGDNGGGDSGGGDSGGGDNGGGDNGGGTCNCNPGEAEGICAADGSDGVLIAHENCNQFYKCAHGVPVAFKCYGTLLYNPYTEQCDWPEKVDCGDRVIPDSQDNDNEGGNDGGSDNGGGDNGGGDNGGGSCNCNPGEAPTICANDKSDGVLVAHENCNQFYKCSQGVPVAFSCYGTLLYNPYTEQCDWPQNVDCGDRLRPDTEKDSNDGNNESDNNNSNDDDVANDEEDCDESINNDTNGTCNCNPSEAQGICAGAGSDGKQVAHENCNQFYQCANGQALALYCHPLLLYNPYTEVCDWPHNVECGDRLIPVPDDNNNETGDNDNGDGDNGSDNGGGHSDPSEAPAICAAEGSDNVLIAHENCNQFYICANGVPVTSSCQPGLLYNPKINWCDWPQNVECGDRLIPESDEDSGNGDESGDNDNNDGSDNGSGGNNGGHYDPNLAPEICAAPGSNSVLVAHEFCNKFYICDHGTPTTIECPNNLLYNPSIGDCDWPINVECGNRTIPDDDGITGPCNCDPRQAVHICSRADSDGMLIAHKNCNQYYICLSGATVERSCPKNLFYNPEAEACDWPSNVSCDARTIPTSHISLNKHLQARHGLKV